MTKDLIKKWNIVNQYKIIIYHQNIRGINNKMDELLLSFTELPHVIGLSEHHGPIYIS
jgi:hypothetical protein